LVLLAASAVVFLLLRVAPGDPARLMLPENATQEEVASLREELGLSRPIIEQYGMFLFDVAHGDLGDSYRYRQPAFEVVLERVPATIALALSALLIAALVSIPLGLISAWYRDTTADHIGSVVALLGQSVPNFWTGAMLVTLFAVILGWLPTSGMMGWKSFILPSISLGLFQAATLYRVTRSAAIETLRQDFVWVVKSKGVGTFVLTLRHVLRNSLIPVLTISAFQLGQLLGGAAVIETIFAWPGIGKLAIDSILQRDFPVVQAVLLISTALFVLINLIVDGLYVVIDPRIAAQK
jgi:peptide/nickel transport system permease protein